MRELFEEKPGSEEPPAAGTPNAKGEKGSEGKGAEKPDPAELEAALSLYRALQDPDISTDVVRTLAKKSGILKEAGEGEKDPPKTKDQEKTERLFVKKLKSALGKDYEKFSEMVGPAIEDAVEELLQSRLGAERQKTTKSTWRKAVDDFNDQFEVTSKVEKLMQELMEENPPNFESARFDASKYLKRRYKEALEELGEEIKPKKSQSSRRSKVDDDEVGEIVEREAPRDVTTDMAVEAALKGIKFVRS